MIILADLSATSFHNVLDFIETKILWSMKNTNMLLWQRSRYTLQEMIWIVSFQLWTSLTLNIFSNSLSNREISSMKSQRICYSPIFLDQYNKISPNLRSCESAHKINVFDNSPWKYKVDWFLSNSRCMENVALKWMFDVCQETEIRAYTKQTNKPRLDDLTSQLDHIIESKFL